MATTTRLINTTPDRVFTVLADGWTYSDWVVGTAHIRNVDDGYPAVGREIHHKAGPWPVSLKDRTTVVECEPDRMLLLKLRLWPLGAGEVRFTLEAVGAAATRITMVEQFTEGPLVGLRNKVNDVLLHHRNRESLRRLADLAVNRARENSPR